MAAPRKAPPKKAPPKTAPPKNASPKKASGGRASPKKSPDKAPSKPSPGEGLSLTGKRLRPAGSARRAGRLLTRAAIDAFIERLPGEVVREVASVGAPLTRFSGVTHTSAALLARSLELLAQPPAAARPVKDEMTLQEIAERLDRPRSTVQEWARAKLLGDPVKTSRGNRWGRQALERARLVDYLLRRGVAAEEVRGTGDTNQLALLVLRRALGTPGGMTRAQVAKEAGLSDELLARLTRALGTATGDDDETVYSARDVEVLRLVGALRSVYSDDDIVEVASVLGRATHEIAEAALELFRRRFAAPFIDAGASELEMMLRLATLVDLTVPTTGPVLELVLRRQLESSARAETIAQLERQGTSMDGQVEQAVGFADLVGFTALSARLSALEVSQMAERLLHTAEEAFVPLGVRIVKSIGDAVMFVAPDPVTAGRAAADLMDRAADTDLPPLHVGIAYGPMLRAYADFFGRTVNIASRLCEVAPAGTIYVLKPGRGTRAADWKARELVVHDAGAKSLKGIDGQVRVVRVAAE
ncbi:MAG: adenylate cyclase [Chloroflexota bacterium]|nr:adenylate cyclase [Chloroflexota bacterium]